MATSQDDNSNQPNEDAEVPDWILARKGIQLLINNNAKEAENLFTRYPDSLPMFAGYSFAVFMDALMSFEDEKLTQATSVLKEVERKCTNDSGWLKSMKRVFSGAEIQQSLAQNLETQIILADSQVCLAILTFLQQDISGYFKGGWILRKAWKIYQNAYQEISNLYKEIIGELHLPEVERYDSSVSSAESEGNSSRKDSEDWDVDKSEFPPPPAPNNGKNAADIDKETIKRLMEAVCFGYGLFQLGISLLPPSLLKLTNFLGFGGNRQNGIACLMYSRKGVDMRAPLATLSLLWFHTIVRPFYALDGSNVQAGVDAASQLLVESEAEYGESALFLFFKGRVNRLNSDIPTALKSFQLAVENSSQREIKILSLHEVGWCHLIQLDYPAAENTFSYLKSWSRWSRGFYSYLAGICTGACETPTNLTNIKEIRNNVVNNNKGINQLDEFLSRRAKCCPSDDEALCRIQAKYYKLLIYEMLYLWNALPSCSRDKIASIIIDCQAVNSNNVEEEPMVGLSKLILGSCYCIQKQYLEGIEQFRICLELRKNLANNSEHTHVSAFAQYEIGSYLIKSPETKEEGKILLQELSQYKDYDFEQRLNVRVHSMLKHL